jgi:hypothetical protein
MRYAGSSCGIAVKMTRIVARHPYSDLVYLDAIAAPSGGYLPRCRCVARGRRGGCTGWEVAQTKEAIRVEAHAWKIEGIGQYWDIHAGG